MYRPSLLILFLLSNEPLRFSFSFFFFFGKKKKRVDFVQEEIPEIDLA